MNSTPDIGPLLKFWPKRKLPALLQTGSSECGLACLAMVATYWGHEVDMLGMRRRFSVSLKGMTMKNMVHMAQAMHLQARPLKVDLEDLGKVRLPAILHWDMDHFVVLKSISKKGVVIHDPALGARTLTIDEVSQSFTGLALEVTPNAGFHKQKERVNFTMLSLVGNVKGLGGGLLQVLLLGIALQIVALVTPFYLQWIVDDVLVSADRDLIPVLGIGFLLLVFVQFVINFVRSWITTVLSSDLNFQWLGNIFSHLVRLPISYFEERHLGDVVSRFNSVRTIQNAVTTQAVEAVIDGMLAIFTFVAMLFYSVKLSLIAVLVIILYVALRIASFKSLSGSTAESVVRAAKQETIFLESVRGVQTIRLFSRMHERRVLWMNALADQTNVDIRIAKLSITYRTVNSLLFGAERVVVIWLAALSVLDNIFSIGMLLAFISYKDQFSQRTASLIDKALEFKMLRIQGERLADIVLTPPEDDEVQLEIETENLSTDLELRNVSFRYADAAPYVLKDLSLKIPSGQCIAISGPSGCGKTTLIKLLLGLLEPSSGEILIGGVNIRNLGLSNFRQMTGSVMQDDLLFAGSIAENISFFDTSPDQERIERCAKLAAVDREIEAMPMRYMSLIGDLGTGLSGGQKQRIVLARALYRSPRILVLDEATSHLDLVNELTINNAIKHLAMTRVVVAHRPDTIEMADRVVLLDAGEISHDQLRTRKPQTVAG